VVGNGDVQLAEVFEADIDGVMRLLGYCCGRKHIFSPQVLCCYGKQLCSIPRDTVYYNYQNRSVFVDFVCFHLLIVLPCIHVINSLVFSMYCCFIANSGVDT